MKDHVDEENFEDEKHIKGLPTLIAVKMHTKVDLHQVISSMLQIPNVENVYEITGDFDVMVVARAFTSFSLNNVIKTIRSLPGVMETNSYLVLQEYKKGVPVSKEKS